MTGRKKHAQRSKYSDKQKYIPVDMFERKGVTMRLLRGVEKAERPGLLASLIGLVKKKARESREQKRPD